MRHTVVCSPNLICFFTDEYKNATAHRGDQWKIVTNANYKAVGFAILTTCVDDK
jgi:hypothetical protein